MAECGLLLKSPQKMAAGGMLICRQMSTILFRMSLDWPNCSKSLLEDGESIAKEKKGNFLFLSMIATLPHHEFMKWVHEKSLDPSESVPAASRIGNYIFPGWEKIPGHDTSGLF